ncbi:hypothetical protein QFC20_006901 [Naganishia adeliensis]|uniref:Uncharacterized protein n=1 Tax=Naganishia adeliensis TaxID=92952 RepID=A0ACC2V5F8_9TREE|nr:hypothetical protein QFC20_006901 [Naganishia adeliensis]
MAEQTAEQVLTATLAARFSQGLGLPPWVDPFMKAVRRLELYEKTEEQVDVAAAAKDNAASGSQGRAGTSPDMDLDESENDGTRTLGESKEMLLESAEEYLKKVI